MCTLRWLQLVTTIFKVVEITVCARAHTHFYIRNYRHPRSRRNIVLTFLLYSVSIPCRVLKSFRGHPPLREWKGSRVFCSLYVTMRLNVIGVSCQLASENTFDLILLIFDLILFNQLSTSFTIQKTNSPTVKNQQLTFWNEMTLFKKKKTSAILWEIFRRKGCGYATWLALK